MPGSESAGALARAGPGRERGFRCEIAWLAPRVLLVDYGGHMPAEDRHVRKTAELVASAEAPVALCYDVTRLASFDRTQVPTHARSLASVAARVVAIAIVGARPAARFGAVTVSLVSRISLQTFDHRGDALAWLGSRIER